MKVMLAPYGTRGDVQPAIALALELRAHGHQVLLAAQERFRSWIESYGLAFQSGDGAEGERGRDEVWRAHLDARPPRQQLRLMAERLIPLQFAALWPASHGADIIVGMGLQFAAGSIAEARQRPYVSVVYTPRAVPSDYTAPPFVKVQRRSRLLNRLMWRLFFTVGDRVARGPLNQGRQSLGLAPARHPSRLFMGSTTILAATPRLAPPPPDLPDHVTMTDAWILDEPGTVDARVDRFIDAGPAPIFIGFGSMMPGDPTRVLREVVAAGELAGCRLLLQGGWAEGAVQDSLPSSCLSLDRSPHHLLFPRVAAAVHHGGAGTCTTAARAGIPQLVVPHLADQFYWGQRMHALGLGPALLPNDQLDAPTLAARLIQLQANPTFRERARGLAELVRSRNGTPAAAALIERLHAQAQPHPGIARGQ